MEYNVDFFDQGKIDLCFGTWNKKCFVIQLLFIRPRHSQLQYRNRAFDLRSVKDFSPNFPDTFMEMLSQRKKYIHLKSA